MDYQLTRIWTLQPFVCMYGVPLDLGLKTRTRTFIGTLIRLPLYPLNPNCLIHFGLVATPSF